MAQHDLYFNKQEMLTPVAAGTVSAHPLTKAAEPLFYLLRNDKTLTSLIRWRFAAYLTSGKR